MGLFILLMTRFFVVETVLIIPLIVVTVLLILSHLLLYSKRFVEASYLLLLTLTGFVLFQLLNTIDGIHDTAIFAVPGILFIAALLLERKPFYLFLAIVLISIAFISLMEVAGISKTRFSSYETLIDAVDILVIFMVTAVAIHLITANFVTNYRRAKKNEELLHELNATKDRFFSIIAHDLKSPFNVILGFTEVLAEQVKEKDYNGIEEYSEIIQVSSQRAMDLLNNLLEWSRSQAGRMNFNPEKIDMDSLIRETTDFHINAIRHKTLSVTLDIPSDAHVYADKHMIRTVVRNLISNAIKFTFPGGMIHISGENRQDDFLVCVKDNGVGIRKEDLTKVFRIDHSITTSGTLDEKGTGLGLILCKDFIEYHRGKIWVESQVGKGSLFFFTIPKSNLP